MSPTIAQYRERLIQLGRKFRATRLDIFGSATSSAFDPSRSDIDLLVEFEPMPPEDHADCYLSLLVALEDLFGRSVDLVEMKAIRNPFFRDAVTRTRQLVYAA
jgi:predicted nucleotidyltransferase